MMCFVLNSLFFSVFQPPPIRIIELCHESPFIVYFAFVTEFYVIFYYRCIGPTLKVKIRKSEFFLRTLCCSYLQ